MATLTLAISGSGGAGAISTGEMLLRIAARNGYFGLLKKTFSPQIRGGEAAAILRIGDEPVNTFADTIDVLVALDWQNFSRFADEVPVCTNTLVLENSAAGQRPEHLLDHGLLLSIDGTGMAASVNSSWVSLIFLALLANALGCSAPSVEDIALERLKKHGADLQQAAKRSLDAGFATVAPAQVGQCLARLQPPAGSGGKRWLASGNQMAALGALEAGVRFVAAYPITPASDLLEWLASHIEECGGHLVQAEDELAAVNMAIGAGFGGVPAMTATSGPGLALMSEAMGLAVASETPLVIVDVMRGGPSTGIPTKSEQSDFNLAVYGLHGDAPHIVVAPGNIADCQYTTAWAVHLATHLQTLAIVLSDQFLGQSLQIFPAPESPPFTAKTTAQIPASDAPYLRYLDTDSGISPLAIPGTPGAMYTADGLEHSQNAVPSPKAKEHSRQLDKRARKLRTYDYGNPWGEVVGEVSGNPLIICWGSTSASAQEAQQRLAAKGITIACLCVRLLSPLPVEKLIPLLAKASRLLVVEQNHGGQFVHFLRGQLPGFNFESLAQPGPKQISSSRIIGALEINPIEAHAHAQT